MTRRLMTPPYLAFPFRIGPLGGELSDRAGHVRDLIEQALFTHLGERVFRPDFGIGLHALLFEPNAEPLWNIATRQILNTLAEVLQGEVDPRSLDVQVRGEGERLRITVSYTLATLSLREQQSFTVGAGGSNDG